MTSQTEFLETMEKWAKLYFFQSLTEFFNYLKHSDLSLLQAYALAYLFYKGSIKITDLCEHMMVSPAAASQMVDRLEKLEMVERVADPKDRRVRKIVVLDSGQAFVQENFAFSQSWLSEIPTDISPERKEKITDVLSFLIKRSGKKDQINE